jgi:hypothetical protein
MEYFLLWLLLSSFWIWGFNYAFQEGEILGRPGDWIRNKWPDWVLSPTIECPKCMASIHGTFWYLYAFWDQYNFIHHTLFVVALCGLNEVLYQIMKDDCEN